MAREGKWGRGDGLGYKPIGCRPIRAHPLPTDSRDLNTRSTSGRTRSHRQIERDLRLDCRQSCQSQRSPVHDTRLGPRPPGDFRPALVPPVSFFPAVVPRATRLRAHWPSGHGPITAPVPGPPALARVPIRCRPCCPPHNGQRPLPATSCLPPRVFSLEHACPALCILQDIYRIAHSVMSCSD